MKVVIVNGSPRVNGATGKVLKEISTHLSAKEDVEVKCHNLSDYELKFCKGCMLCHKTGKCIITDDGINDLVQEIKNCDAVVFGSPTYGSNVAGQFKTFIDRGGFVFGQLLGGKYGFAVSTYENFAGKQAINVIKKLFLLSGASRRGEYILKLDHNTEPFTDPKTVIKLHKKIDSFYRAVKYKKSKKPIERFLYKIITQVGLKPRMIKNPTRFSANIERWRELGLL